MMTDQNIETFEGRHVGNVIAFEAARASTVPDDIEDQLSHCESDPARDGNRVVKGLQSGARAIIKACTVVASTVRRYEKDRDSIDQFLGVLVDGNVISQAEARMKLTSPKLSKLRKIGDHAKFLLREDIFRHLSPSYSLMHQVCVLYNSLEGDDEARAEQIINIFKGEGTLSRDFVGGQTKLAKQAKETKHGSTHGASTPDRACEGAIGAEGIAHAYDLVFLEPDRGDIRRLNDEYADERPPCLQVHERIAADAVAITIARLLDLPIVANEFLSHCGFEQPSRIILAQDPNGRDVTNAEIVIVAVRGQPRFDLPEDFAWPSIGEPIDANSIVARLVPDAVNKLHVFASAETEGWSSIVGEANWRHADE